MNVDLSGLGKFLVVAGILLVVLGLVFFLAGKGVIPRLPGDLSFGKGNTRVYVPLGTSIVLSVVLTTLVNLIFRR
ncbi:MAG TPA: DUF2905 domain-containing protein [Actinomycetota bacterium]|nr:DUF2905 domain-containing protein [Actinomycetota bacterium]